MGDGDDGALVVVEEALEPGDRLGVEVVRRLVEQQQVGRGEQQPAERDAAPLAARERRHVAVAVGQPQRVHRAVERARRASQASWRSICSCTVACSASSASKSASGSANAAEIALKRSSRSRSVADAVLDVAAHVLGRVELGLLLRGSPTVAPGASSATPLDGSSRPAMIRSSVDLPAPFGPSTPIFAPGQERRARCSRAPGGRGRRTCRPGTS